MNEMLRYVLTTKNISYVALLYCNAALGRLCRSQGCVAAFMQASRSGAVKIDSSTKQRGRLRYCARV